MLKLIVVERQVGSITTMSMREQI